MNRRIEIPFILKPRHNKILVAIARNRIGGKDRPMTENLLWEKTGVIHCKIYCRELTREGYLKSSDAGWTLTEKGKKWYNENNSGRNQRTL